MTTLEVFLLVIVLLEWWLITWLVCRVAEMRSAVEQSIKNTLIVQELLERR